MNDKILVIPSRVHNDDLPGTIIDDGISYPVLTLEPVSEKSEDWQEEWRFNLHCEDKENIRGYVQFGGRLSCKNHFMPRAKAVCQERNLSLVQVEGFKADVNMSRDTYVVSACVTLKRNPSK